MTLANMKLTRKCFRCPMCLECIFVDGLKTHHEAGQIACPFCDHHFLEYLGPVECQHFSESIGVCRCNERCICATGPKCDCSCDGKNHGSGLLWELQEGSMVPKGTTIDDDAVTRMMLRRPKALKRAAEWRQSLELLNSVWEVSDELSQFMALCSEKIRIGFLPAEHFAEWRRLSDLKFRIKRMRSSVATGRNKIAANFRSQLHVAEIAMSKVHPA